MTRPFNPGIKVTWQDEEGDGHGVIEESFIETTEKVINGERCSREASARNPAYLITANNGDQVIKSHSEVEAD